MPISSTAYTWGPYAGNGSTTIFNYGQPLQSINDLGVFLTDNNGIIGEPLTSGVDYQVNGVGNSSLSAWTITYPMNSLVAPLPIGWTLTINLNVALITNTSLTTINTSSGPVIQSAIDRLTLQDLTQQAQIQAMATEVAAGGVLSVNGMTGAVTVPSTAATQAQGNNSLSIANTAFVQNPLYVLVNGLGSGGQTIANNTPAKCQFVNPYAGKTSWFDGVTNYRFIPQVAGKYRVKYQFDFSSLTASGFVIGAINLNGTGVQNTYAYMNYVSGAFNSYTVQGEQIIPFNGSTDYVEIWVTQVTGASQTIQTNGVVNNFEAEFISAS